MSEIARMNVRMVLFLSRAHKMKMTAVVVKR